MTETRETLEARKRELFAAIHTLDRDHEDGTLEDAAYRSARERYELEAADVLAQLDALPPETGLHSTPAAPRRRSRAGTWITLGIVVACIAVILFGALARRDESAALSRVPTPTAGPASKALTKALQAVLKDPRSAHAQMVLGNAYLKLGESKQADRRYLEAMRLDPKNPQPVTLHAMVLGAGSRGAEALRILSRVEREHPRYARAWLLDGLLSSHSRSTVPRAIRAWKRFLALEPHSPLAPAVRGSIAAAQKGTRSTK